MENANIEKVELKDTKEIDLPTLDLKQYIGTKTQIDFVEEFKGEFGYFIRISTLPIGNFTNREGEVIDLRASRNLGLQEDESGSIGWGKETNMGYFLEKMKVDHYNDLIGKDVIIQLQSNPKTKKEYLSFN